MKTLLDSDNLKAVLVWVLMCVGLGFTGVIFAKIFAPETPTTTINNYFIGNKEVFNGFSKFPHGY